MPAVRRPASYGYLDAVGCIIWTVGRLLMRLLLFTGIIIVLHAFAMLLGGSAAAMFAIDAQPRIMWRSGLVACVGVGIIVVDVIRYYRHKKLNPPRQYRHQKRKLGDPR